MRIYVAGKWSRRAEARELMDKLELAGHHITHDWTREDEENPDDEYLRGCAEADLDGVLGAEAFVLLHDSSCRGAFVELGMMLMIQHCADEYGATQPRILVVGGKDANPLTECPIFYKLRAVEHLARPSDVLAALS